MSVCSLDLRERVIAAYDRREGSLRVLAQRFCVSKTSIQNWLNQRRREGHIRPHTERQGDRPLLSNEQRQHLLELVQTHPGWTLKRFREELQIDCSLSTICRELIRLGYRFKKRHSGPASRIGTTSSSPETTGRA